MNIGFYPKLALDGIRKNKQIYLPYLLTCIGMVMMTYIVNYLKYAKAIALLPGSSIIQSFMNIGFIVIILFAAIFLFYTNQFLIRRRKKEFGLYNILGMGKKNISIILLWEAFFTALFSITVGLICGFAVSKLAELGFVNLLDGKITYTLSISPEGIILTVIPFLGIFLLLLLNSLRQIRFSSAISLLRSENVGEKPPKANWFFGIIGMIILAVAYYMAVTIKDPISAIGIFIVAVIMVIIATYIIMISGSVLFCRILQKRKNYYYKPNHFVSVSSMVYRMKRNGAGLASICIIATMVLVMISSTSALFIGGESVLRNRYPREINTWFKMYENKNVTKEDIALFDSVINSVIEKNSAVQNNIIRYNAVITAGMLNNGDVIFDPNSADDMDFNTFSDVHQIYFVSIEDYNYITGRNVTLNSDEALIYSPRTKFKSDIFGFTGQKKYKVKEHLSECFTNSDVSADIVPNITVIVPDISEASAGLVDSMGNDLTNKKWYYSFDTSLEDEGDIALCKEIKNALTALQKNGHDIFISSVESREYERQDFYSIYGGIFYLGIILSIAFLFAAVLIIYYKQISEGYEDQSRFEIMQKVGMTKKNIRKSINSQLLTVFFLPLIGAGLHLAFAFPIIEKLLLLFNLNNRPLFICTAMGSFLIFAVFYVIVYRITANSYYKISISENNNL